MKIPECNMVHAKEFGQCIEDIFLKQVGYAIHSLHICYWNLKQIGYAVHSLHISYPPPPSPETIWLHSYPTESHANRKINKWTYFPTNEHSCLPTLHRYVQFKTGFFVLLWWFYAIFSIGQEHQPIKRKNTYMS